MSLAIKNEPIRRSEHRDAPVPGQPARIEAPTEIPTGEGTGLGDRPRWLDRSAYAERTGAVSEDAPDAAGADARGFRGLGSERGAGAALSAGDRPQVRSNAPGYAIGAGNRRARDPGVEDHPADGAGGGAGAAMTRARARERIDAVMRMSTSSCSSDDYVRDHITPEVLAHATPEEKAHMLRCLMEGWTGGGDERAMAMILRSIGSADEMGAVLRAAGGADAVWDELEDARSSVIDHFRGMGAPGAAIILKIGEGLSTGSSDSDDYVRDYVDDAVLAQASNDQKSHFLRCLMDGPTGSGDERAMRRVLQSVQTPADMTAVLAGAGGVREVWGELEDQRADLIRHLRSQGETGQQRIGDLALGLSVEDRAAIVRQLRQSPTDADRATIQRIRESARDPIELATISGLNGEQRGLVEQAYRANRGDATFVRNLTHLLLDRRFTELGSDTQTAVLSQVRNYPDARSVHNLERLVQKDWFRSMSLQDQQRSLATIAFLSQYDGGDRTIIDNTLDRFLDPASTHQFDWTKTGTAYGSAGTRDFHFNRRYLRAGNDPIDRGNDDTLHMVTHTAPHEVNHIVNNDRVAQTAEYFQQEYRAYFVGFRAQHGRDPTRAEVLGRVRHLLTDTDGAYNNIRLALADPVEGPKIVAFMQQLLGRTDVTQANAATLPAVDPDHAAPRPTGDLDN